MVGTLTAYSGSGCTGLVGTDLFALVECAPHDDLVHAIWPAVHAGDFPALIAVLTSRGVARLPAFVVAEIRGNKVVVLVRGRLRASAYQGGEVLESLMADSVTTWRESTFIDADRVVLSSAELMAGTPLPLLGGVVSAGALDRRIVPPAAGLSQVDGARAPNPEPLGPRPDPWQMVSAGEPPNAVPALPDNGSETRTWIEPGTSVEPGSPPLPAMSPGGLLDRIFPDDQVSAAPAPQPAVVPLDEIRFESGSGDAKPGGWQRPRPGGLVAAVRCPKLHLNPPATPACRECQVPLDPRQVPEYVSQPRVGWLRRVETGERWPLSRPVLTLGRASGPGQIALTGPVSDLHAEVRLTGWRVEVIDRSDRGTFVVNLGGKKERLVPGTPARLLLGGRIILADAVTFLFEVS